MNIWVTDPDSLALKFATLFLINNSDKNIWLLSYIHNFLSFLANYSLSQFLNYLIFHNSLNTHSVLTFSGNLPYKNIFLRYTSTECFFDINQYLFIQSILISWSNKDTIISCLKLFPDLWNGTITLIYYRVLLSSKYTYTCKGLNMC